MNYALPTPELMSANPSTHKFEGIITKILHEAFYLEEQEEIGVDFTEVGPFESEDQSDQNSFIQKFLSPFF